MKSTLDIVTQALSEQAEDYDASDQAVLSALCRSLLIRMRRIASEEQEHKDATHLARLEKIHQ